MSLALLYVYHQAWMYSYNEAETKWLPFSRQYIQMDFLNENIWILIKISLNFVSKGQINNILLMVQIMAWHQPGNKPLSEPMMP